MASYERPEVMKCDKPSVPSIAGFQYNSDNAYGDCPLVILSSSSSSSGVGGGGGGRVRYVQMKNWIKCLSLAQVPLSYHFQEYFSDTTEEEVGSSSSSSFQRLDGLRWQRYLYEKLWFEGFSTVNFPFKLEKWDPESNRWRMLTIDCHVTVAPYLIFLGKHPDRKFIDPVHSCQKIGFRTNKVFKSPNLRELDYIEVTPMLVTPKEAPERDINEGLRLTVTDVGLFPMLRFTMPAMMAPPPPDFNCGICFNGIDEDHHHQYHDREQVFRAECGGGLHCFHRQCIERWFSIGKSSCPMCRTTIKHFIV